MSKNLDNFKNIIITNDILSTVDSFKAIVGPGKKRPTLDTKAHKALVHKKYDDARKIDDHITIFRVNDKKDLPPKEKNNHTVQGPEWTPPSSVGFVMGAQSKGLRIWSATKPTGDSNGLLGEKGKPSIFARESMSALKSGWMAREPHEHEKYGNTKRSPVTVFTPPSSPKHVLIEEIRSIMDINAGWENLPIQLSKLITLSTPIPKELTDGLKKSRLTREDLDNALLAIVANTRGVLQLITKNSLSIAELNEAPIDIVRELLQEEEVIVLLSDGAVKFDELMRIYSEYIDGSDNQIGEFSFQKLHSLITSDQSKFSKLLLFGLKLNINDIIRLYNDDYDMFCAFANDNAISFFEQYGKEIDIEDMIRIYHDNP
jgi:hypothetical protein